MNALQTISSLGTLACVVLFGGFGAAIVWSFRADAADAHTIHIGGCVDCAADDERLGV